MCQRPEKSHQFHQPDDLIQLREGNGNACRPVVRTEQAMTVGRAESVQPCKPCQIENWICEYRVFEVHQPELTVVEDVGRDQVVVAEGSGFIRCFVRLRKLLELRPPDASFVRKAVSSAWRPVRGIYVDSCQFRRSKGGEHAARRDAAARFEQRLLEGLAPLAPRVNGDPERRIPTILNLWIPDCDKETLIEAWAPFAAISDGAACTSQSYTCSHVLAAMGVEGPAETGAVRLSWCHLTEEPDTVAMVRACRAEGRGRVRDTDRSTGAGLTRGSEPRAERVTTGRPS